MDYSFICIINICRINRKIRYVLYLVISMIFFSLGFEVFFDGILMVIREGSEYKFISIRMVRVYR